MFEIKRQLRFLLISPDSDDVFVFIDNHVFTVPYSQQYICSVVDKCYGFGRLSASALSLSQIRANTISPLAPLSFMDSSLQSNPSGANVRAFVIKIPNMKAS